MIYWFYLDDERPVPFGEDMILVPDGKSMISLIDLCEKYNIPFCIDYDHDLGDDYYTGYTVAKYVVEHQATMCGFKIHSMNPVGAANIRQLLTHYGYKEMV